MKRFEIIMLILFGVALILKLASIPGGSILSTLSLCSLACFYFYLGLAFFNNIKLKNIFKGSSYKDISALRIIVSIGVGCGFSALCCGILFKIQHWPGGMIMLSVGLIEVLIMVIIALIDYFKSNGNLNKTILLRIAVIGGIGILFWFTSDFTIIKIQYRNYPAYIKAYERLMDDPSSFEAREQLEIEYNKIIMPREEEVEK